MVSDRSSDFLRTTILTGVAMVAFAANSLLYRLAIASVLTLGGIWLVLSQRSR